MPSSFKTIKEQAKALSAKERADLAQELITSLDDEVDVDVDSKWDEEIRKRVSDIKSGKERKAGRLKIFLPKLEQIFHEESNFSSGC